MQNYKTNFIEFCIDNEIIRFGEFTLKSGRKSPYFFNAGLFNTGELIAKLGEFYAESINAAKLNFDILFGPAYKGIPLVVSTAIALAKEQNINKPFCFNRKSEKSHGEGGMLVGAPLYGKVLIIDDVITAGTAIREVTSLAQQNNAEISGVCVALDRQEKGTGKTSAIQEIEQEYNISVISIINFDDIIEHLKTSSDFNQYAEQMMTYRQQYGV
ncbi:MAG: orotate phosphoribosyltransferase [Candidatus Neomarinimicrobiota bacterium]